VRLAFLGTPEVAAGTLAALAGAGHEVVVVVTRPDKRRGRGLGVSPSPVKAMAVELGLPVVHRVDEALGAGASLGVVVAYGRLVKPDALARLPMVNVHFSLLPRWRGAAPVERAVLAGDATTGVCLMKLEEGLDTGPVYARREVPIGAVETVAQLRARLAALGTSMLLEALEEGLPHPVPQQGEPTYAEKVGTAELALEFSETVELNLRRVRVGRAWTTLRGRRLIVHRAQPADVAGTERALAPGELDGRSVGCGDGRLELLEVQPEGKPAMAAAAWSRGARVGAGERLGA
jgi:methionyl-tRNA formyltransferase